MPADRSPQPPVPHINLSIWHSKGRQFYIWLNFSIELPLDVWLRVRVVGVYVCRCTVIWIHAHVSDSSISNMSDCFLHEGWRWKTSDTIKQVRASFILLQYYFLKILNQCFWFMVCQVTFIYTPLKWQNKNRGNTTLGSLKKFSVLKVVLEMWECEKQILVTVF